MTSWLVLTHHHMDGDCGGGGGGGGGVAGFGCQRLSDSEDIFQSPDMLMEWSQNIPPTYFHGQKNKQIFDFPFLISPPLPVRESAFFGQSPLWAGYSSFNRHITNFLVIRAHCHFQVKICQCELMKGAQCTGSHRLAPLKQSTQKNT